MIGAYPALNEAKQALDEGRQELAARIVVGHLRKNPGEPRGLTMLAMVAMKSGALQQAEAFFRQAMDRGNRTPEVRKSLAGCLHQQERLADSLELWNGILAE